MVKITIQDFGDRSSYVCERGRFWFRKHGLDWSDFKRNGVDVAVLRATGDHLSKIDKLEQTALRRIAAGGADAT